MFVHAELLKVRSLHCCQDLQRTCVILMSAHAQAACADVRVLHQLRVAPLAAAWSARSTLAEFPFCCVAVRRPRGWRWVVFAVVSVFGGCMCVSSLQARVQNDILDYKDLAALPKIKAIYEVQQPDLISSSYQPYHRYTSDERLDTYSYGEVLLLHTPGQT